METITFTCKVITPMFLAGADGQTPELRAPSIKGAMRFWWRALNGHLPLAEMKRREAEIFGGSGDNSTRSSFSIQIINAFSDSDFSDSVWKEIGCTKGTSKSGNEYIDSRNAANKGIAYLFYSTWLDVRNLKISIKSGSQFSFRIILHKKDVLNDVISALNALFFLGSLGTRSRRGAGSMTVTDIECGESLKEKEMNLKKIFCNRNINSTTEVTNHLNSIFSITDHEQNNFSHLKGSRIYVFDPRSNWISALESIGKPFFTYRNSVQSKISETPNFGFPIVHRSSNTTMQGGKNIYNLKKENFLERRASPIIFKLIQFNENEFFPLLIWLNGELIPDDHVIMDKSGGNKAQPSNQLIEIFFQHELKRTRPNIIL